MAATQVAYRLTLYAGRSVDPTEATVLTPVAGSAHSDSFRITTMQGLSGYQPYMGIPQGRRCRLEPLSKNTDVGEISVPILDVKAGAKTDNLTRWMTTFIGNASGRLRLAGLKAKVEESLDAGVTWSDYFTGRVSGLSLSNKLWYTLTLRDLGVDLDAPIFVGEPHAALTASTGYVQAASLLPPALMRTFGNYPTGLPLRGTIARRHTRDVNGVTYAVAYVDLDTASRGRADNVILANLLTAAEMPGMLIVGTFNLPTLLGAVFTDRIRAHIKRLDTNAEGDFQVGPIAYVPYTVYTANDGNVAQGTVNRALQIMVRELPRNNSTEADPPGYLALPTDGTSVEIHLKTNDLEAGLATYFISDVHPVTLWEDVMKGRFGYLYKAGQLKPSTAAIGDVLRSYPYSTSVFANLSSDKTYPDARFVVTKKTKIHEWVRSNILQPYQLGYYIDGSGQTVPVDLRRPSSLPTITITDTDLVEGQQNLGWEYGSEIVTKVVAHYYEDSPTPPSWGARVGTGPGQEPTYQQNLPVAGQLVAPSQHTVEILDLAHFDVGQNDVTIDAQGFRSFPNETVTRASSTDTSEQSRGLYLKSKLREFSANLQQPYRGGAAYISLVCRRTSNTNSVQPGTDVVLDIDALPDPRTNLRGGARVGRCVERSPEGVKVMLRFLDLGANVAANAPSLGVPALQTGSTRHGAQVDVTPNANGDAQEIHYAIATTGSTSPPAEGSMAWAMAQVRASTSTGTVTVEGLPRVGRTWFRARSVPSGLDRMEQASSWVAAGAPGYIDMPGITAPSALAASTANNKAKQVVLTWTNGSSELPIDVRLTTPSTATMELIATLQPLQTQYRVLGLVSGTCYQAGVRHNDLLGGYSTETTLIFTTSTEAATAPSFGGIGVVVGAST